MAGGGGCVEEDLGDGRAGQGGGWAVDGKGRRRRRCDEVDDSRPLFWGTVFLTSQTL